MITVNDMIRWLSKQPRNGVLVATQRKGGAWQHPDSIGLCERKDGSGDADVSLMVIAPTMIDQVIALPPRIGAVEAEEAIEEAPKPRRKKGA